MKYIIFSLLITIISSCINNLEDIEVEISTPDLDMYVFRGENGFRAPDYDNDGEEDFNVVNYILNSFFNDSYSVGILQSQVKMEFDASKIRVFLVSQNQDRKVPDLPVLSNTHVKPFVRENESSTIESPIEEDCAPIPDNSEEEQPHIDNSLFKPCFLNDDGFPFFIFVEEERRFILADASEEPCPPNFEDPPGNCIHKCYIGDFDTNYKFTLTDIKGEERKGTVEVDPDNVRIYFVNEVDPCGTNSNGVSGVSIVGNEESIQSPDSRYQQYYIGIAHRYTVGLGERFFHSLQSIRPEATLPAFDPGIFSLASTISHELGHYFGLYHSFEEESCDYVPGQGNTINRIMDYVAEPRIFTQCETNIYTRLSQLYSGRMLRYVADPVDENIQPIERRPIFIASKETSTPQYNSKQNIEKMAYASARNMMKDPINPKLRNSINEGRIQVFSGNWDGHISIKGNTKLLDNIKKINMKKVH